MPLRTTLAKAIAQIERHDAQGAQQYRAELKYFHYKPRAILGMTTAYEIWDETFTFREPSPLLKQAAVYGPEFVERMLAFERITQEVAETLATQQDIPRHLLGYPQA